jgi:hypothetical protein
MITAPKTQKLSSIVATRKHGVPPSILRNLITRYFHLPELFKDLLESYYLLYWDPKYLREQLAKNKGTLYRGGYQFVPVYHGCSPASILSSPQVVLSFRVPNVEYRSIIPCYVLIGVPKK